MTVIAACVTGGHAAMGADTASFADGRIWHDGEKIFTLPLGSPAKAAERITFGFAGQSAIGAIVRRNLKLKTPSPGDERDFLYTVAAVICEMVVDAKPPPVEDGHVDGHCLVLLRSQLWLLSQQDVGRIQSGYTAIGSGGDVALGALAAMADTDLTAEERVRRAVSIAELHCDGVRVLDGAPQLHLE